MTTHDPVRFINKNMRVDLRLIAEMIAPGSRVLDIGCGDGSLIDHLSRTKGCDARGIEIDMAEVIRAVAHGMPVMHGDADIDLAHYPDGAFDYVVLSRTLQAVEQPRVVLRQMLRIGTRAVVSFPNFGHWLVRWQLFSTGRLPMMPEDARRGGGFLGWPTCSVNRGCFCCGGHAATGDAPAVRCELDGMSN